MIEKYIAQDYIAFLTEHQIELSEWDRATLTFQNARMPYREKRQTLQEIADQTADPQLKQQITNRLLEDMLGVKRFMEPDSSVYYELSIWYDEGFQSEGIYRSFDFAYKAGCRWSKRSFRIVKRCFDDMQRFSDVVIGWMYFRSDGECLSMKVYDRIYQKMGCGCREAIREFAADVQTRRYCTYFEH